jgi:hypothetical protein
VTLAADLERAAVAAAALGDEDERLAGVVAAEPAGRGRVYLAAFERGEERSWLVLDADGNSVAARDTVRETASIAALCELAAEVAGGGQLEELRLQLARLRVSERPPGIEDAEEAALALEHAIGGEPRVATPAYLDEVGGATLALERALGDVSSPFASAMRSSTGIVDDFVADVLRGYRVELG